MSGASVACVTTCDPQDVLLCWRDHLISKPCTGPDQDEGTVRSRAQSHCNICLSEHQSPVNQHSIPAAQVSSSAMALTEDAANIVRRYECCEGEIHVLVTLYRVRYDESNLLTARATPAFGTREEFKSAVEMHLIWINRVPTPFVSLFASLQHAVNWANRRKENHPGEEVAILYLDVEQLGPIFSVRHLVEERNVYTHLPESMYRDEYLVLGEIPRTSVTEETVVGPPRVPVEFSSDDENSDEESSGSGSDDAELVLGFDNLNVASHP
ncbi:hypothetical protein PHYPSEUDO_012023 [Phytophthora pseudosyringae]|uniref:DUF7587 domain-containing protein n=1 Tax=Phytophthora pseudosyringae TaxID=221518 RepID=A0A8T1V8D1_9STRA|nr:hypothetical protein PHYPSEUDO_012023 [Phytophthora pseudosyringae]